MSRIGKLPISIPETVKVKIDGLSVYIDGPKGKLKKSFTGPVTIEQIDKEIIVKPVGNTRQARAMYGTVRSIINGMVVGVMKGFKKELEIHGVGFRASVENGKLDLALGYSHPVLYPIPQNITVTVTDNTKIAVEGPDKHLVGQVAADIKHYYPVEPYKGKGVRIVGQYVRRKEGKKAG